MPVRDLLWGCPVCRVPGVIRPDGRHERCSACGAAFRRGDGADIVVEHRGRRDVRPAAAWLRTLGPLVTTTPRADGTTLGPERVRVKIARRHEPVRFGGNLLGFAEVYEPTLHGAMILSGDGLRFAPDKREPLHWIASDILGLQPASSSIQLRVHDYLASIRFLEGSVRLWTRAVTDLVREHHRQHGRDLLELQPHVRTCPLLRPL